MASDFITFWRQLNGSFKSIGAVVPSSPVLAHDMVRPLRETRGPRLILEVGPGTGPFTRQILKLMGERDQFVICEINPAFLRQLRDRLRRNRWYQKHSARVRFFEGAVQKLRATEQPKSFDVIVCSVPFTNFTPEVTEDIMATMHHLLARDGKMTFVEYLGGRRLHRLLGSRDDRERVRGVDAVMARWRRNAKRRGQVKTSIALFNVPPAKTIQFDY